VGSDEGNLDVRIAVFDRLSDADVAREARRAGEKNEQFVILTGADGPFRGNVVGGASSNRAPSSMPVG